ncbi:MAG: DEAD/DEAH box helicase [Candidatus Hodarchaeota archaeon]
MFTIDPTSGRKVRLLGIVDVIPKKYQSLFPFETFNRIQTAIFPLVFNTDKNLVVATPTGSGKTTIGELAIVRALDKKKPALYLSPLRAISYEKEETWTNSFGSCGFNVVVITGETEIDIEKLLDADIILSTTEKWDSLSRNRQNHFLIQRLGVMVIDEVHLLDDPERGGTLEVVVSRMKRFAPECRIIALSATLPGAEEIGIWLNAEILEFGSEYRPAKLNVRVYPYPQGSNPFADKYRRIYRCLDISRRYLPKGDQALVFVASRGDTYLAAKKVMEVWHERNYTPLQAQERKLLQQTIQSVSQPRLRSLLESGLAYHNAGLPKRDRKIVEELFRQGLVKMLFSTSTLAWGVNLPAKVVIVRDITLHDALKGEIDISPLDLHQMLGRAGRPQYDKEGFGYILVPEDKDQQYQKLLRDMKRIESHILDQLEEHLNAEIQLGTIKSEDDAKKWFQNLFLGTRMQNDSDLATKSIKVFQTALERLINGAFVTKDAERFTGSTLGKLTALFYLKLETATLFQEFAQRPSWSEVEIISILAQAEEFRDVIFRRNEKRHLKDALAYFPKPFLKELSSGQQKILGILQTILIGESIHESMTADARVLIENSLRLLAALRVFIREITGETEILLDLLFLELRLKNQEQNIDHALLLQVPNLGKTTLTKLLENNLSNLNSLRDLIQERGQAGLETIGIRKDRARSITQTINSLPIIKISVAVPESIQDGLNSIPIHIELSDAFWIDVRIKLNGNSVFYQRKKFRSWDLPLELNLKSNRTYHLEILAVVQPSLVFLAKEELWLTRAPEVSPPLIKTEDPVISSSMLSETVSKTSPSLTIIDIPSGTDIIAKGIIRFNVDIKKQYTDKFSINFLANPKSVVITTDNHGVYQYPVTDAIFTSDESLIEIEGSVGSIKIILRELVYTNYKALLGDSSPPVVQPEAIASSKVPSRTTSNLFPERKSTTKQRKGISLKINCKKCGVPLEWIEDNNLVVCSNCSENYKIPTKSQLIEEECERCGLPMVAISQLYSLKVCINRTCQNMDDIVRTRFENEGYQCPNCQSPLKVIRRRGLIAGCTNYYDRQQPCKTAFSLPRNSLIVDRCICGLPFIQLKTKSRCLNTACKFNQKSEK